MIDQTNIKKRKVMNAIRKWIQYRKKMEKQYTMYCMINDICVYCNEHLDSKVYCEFCEPELHDKYYVVCHNGILIGRTQTRMNFLNNL